MKKLTHPGPYYVHYITTDQAYYRHCAYIIQLHILVPSGQGYAVELGICFIEHIKPLVCHVSGFSGRNRSSSLHGSIGI